MTIPGMADKVEYGMVPTQATWFSTFLAKLLEVRRNILKE